MKGRTVKDRILGMNQLQQKLQQFTMSTTIIIASIWLSISLVMGVFSITQLGYQDRMSPLEEKGKSLISFVRGFIFWPLLFPAGISRSKYKCKVVHKVSTGRSVFRK